MYSEAYYEYKTILGHNLIEFYVYTLLSDVYSINLSLVNEKWNNKMSTVADTQIKNRRQKPEAYIPIIS